MLAVESDHPNSTAGTDSDYTLDKSSAKFDDTIDSFYQMPDILQKSS